MQKQQNQQAEENRLKYFPIMMFAIVMGLSGLTIVYQKAGEILGFNHNISIICTIWIE